MSFSPFKEPQEIFKIIHFSCSLDHNFSFTHSIFIILDFLEVERYPGQNEIDNDSQDTVQSCTYVALECSDIAKNARKAQTRPAPAISFCLIAQFRLFLLCTLENITSEAPAN